MKDVLFLVRTERDDLSINYKRNAPLSAVVAPLVAGWRPAYSFGDSQRFSVLPLVQTGSQVWFPVPK